MTTAGHRKRLEVPVSLSGVEKGRRARLNFIAGSGIGLTIIDDGTDERVNISIAATGPGGPAIQLNADGTVLDVNVITVGEFLIRVGTTVVSTAINADSPLAFDMSSYTFSIAPPGEARGDILVRGALTWGSLALDAGLLVAGATDPVWSAGAALQIPRMNALGTLVEWVDFTTMAPGTHAWVGKHTGTASRMAIFDSGGLADISAVAATGGHRWAGDMTWQLGRGPWSWTGPPVIAGMTWLNQVAGGVTATATRTKGTIYVSCAARATNNISLYYVTGTNLAAHIRFFGERQSNLAAGLAWYESGTGKLETVHLRWNAGVLELIWETWTNVTTWASTRETIYTGLPTNWEAWIRLRIVGANMWVEEFDEGPGTWFQISAATYAKNSHFTAGPDKVGPSINPCQAASVGHATILLRSYIAS